MMSIQRNAQRQQGILRGVLSRVSRALIQPIARWNKRRAMIATLSSLDDRMLADIGLTRSEIAQVANGQIPRGGKTRHSSPAAEAISPPVEPVNEMRRAA